MSRVITSSTQSTMQASAVSTVHPTTSEWRSQNVQPALRARLARNACAAMITVRDCHMVRIAVIE